MSSATPIPPPQPAAPVVASGCLFGSETPGEPYDVTRTLGHQIVNLMMLMRRTVEARMVAHGLTNAQWKPLWMIDRGRAETTNELARAMDVDASAVTRLVDRLEAKGLLERVRSSTDRRVVKLCLTPAGQATVKVIAPILAGVNREFLSGFSAEEMAMLQNSLTRMTANGAAMLNTTESGGAEDTPAAPAPATDQEYPA